MIFFLPEEFSLFDLIQDPLRTNDGNDGADQNDQSKLFTLLVHLLKCDGLAQEGGNRYTNILDCVQFLFE